MSDNIVTKKKKTKNRMNEETVINRLMALFVGAVVLVSVLLLLKKSNLDFQLNFVIYVLPWLWGLFSLTTAACAALYIYRKVKHKDDSGKTFSAGILLIVSIALLVLSLAYKSVSITNLIIGVIVMTALCFIFSFYSRDFFAYSAFTACGAALLYATRPSVNISHSVKMTILTVLLFALPVIVALLSFVLMKNDGSLKLGERKYRLLEGGSKYFQFYIGAILLLVGALVSMFIASAFLYAVLAFLAFYLVCAVIFTVKMI